MTKSLIPHLPYIFYNYVLRQDKPFLAGFKLTYRCNLKCEQCPFYTLQAPELSFEQVCGLLDALYQRGNRMVIFEGGEPFLWRDGDYGLQDVVNYARQRFYRVGITTNGTLPLAVNSDVIWVSIDGLRDTHNKLRGRAIFDQVIGHIQASTHPRIYAHITVNAVNAPEIPALIRYLTPIVKGITIQFYYPYHQRDALFLDFAKRAALLDAVIQLKRAGYPVLNSVPALRALKDNSWRCDDRLIDNLDPDGSMHQGCYLKTRADIDCSKCGFSPHTEISLACRGNLASIWAGKRIFFS